MRDKSLWQIKETRSHSWNWKVILRLRNVAQRFVGCTVGNGQTFSFWHDPWPPFGPLIDYIGRQGPRSMRIPIHAKVANACSAQGWIFSGARSDAEVQLHTYLSTLRLPTSIADRDSYHWLVNGEQRAEYSSTETWEVLRSRTAVKSWARIVWYKGAIPAHAFHFWITQWNRLPTRFRISSWTTDPNHSSMCVLCSGQEETQDHVFFQCRFAESVWCRVLTTLHQQQETMNSWSRMMRWLTTIQNKDTSTLANLASQATVYQIWKQRNNLLHNGVRVSAATVYRMIDKDVRNAISGRRTRKRWRSLMQMWFRNL